MTGLLYGVCVLFSPYIVWGYEYGAPELACNFMIPAHPVSPQTSVAPYVVTLSNTTYGPNGILTGNIISESPLKGFFIQARSASNPEAVTKFGTFTPDVEFNQLLRCQDQGVTHSENSLKYNVSFTWTAPNTLEGPLVFVATLVAEVETFWTKVYSGDIGDGTEPDNSNITTSTEQNQHHSTTPDNHHGNNNDDLTACGDTIGCFMEADCDGMDCRFLVTWRPHDDVIDFTISASVGAGDSKWVAVGFSDDAKMGDDSVIECNVIDGPIKVQQSYNTDGSINNNEPIDDPLMGLSHMTGTYADGRIRCQFTREITLAVHDHSRVKRQSNDMNKIVNLNASWHMLIAMGNMLSADVKGFHDFSQASVEKINFLELKTSTSTDKIPYIKAHGSLMVLAWIMFSSIGIIVSRYFKNNWPKTKLFGANIWFQIHRLCMLLVVLMTCIAFILIFVRVGGYSQVCDI